MTKSGCLRKSYFILLSWFLVPPANESRAKRPAWDLKGRVQDLEQLLYGKSNKLKENSVQLTTLSTQKTELESALTTHQRTNIELENKVHELEKTLR